MPRSRPDDRSAVDAHRAEVQLPPVVLWELYRRACADAARGGVEGFPPTVPSAICRRLDEGGVAFSRVELEYIRRQLQAFLREGPSDGSKAATVRLALDRLERTIRRTDWSD